MRSVEDFVRNRVERVTAEKIKGNYDLLDSVTLREFLRFKYNRRGV